MVQKEVDEEIVLVRNDVELDLIDVGIVDTSITQLTDYADGEIDVSEDKENEFSDRESDIDALKRDLKETNKTIVIMNRISVRYMHTFFIISVLNLSCLYINDTNDVLCRTMATHGGDNQLPISQTLLTYRQK